MRNTTRHHTHFQQILIALPMAAIFLSANAAWAAKNVVLMIADGGGHNAWLAAAMYQCAIGRQVYDRDGWIHCACTTYPLNLSHRPTGDMRQDASVVYDAAKAWDASREASGQFTGYAYLKATATDSAAAATALATGRKTYNNAINWSNGDRPLRGMSIAEIAAARGRSTGVVTTVPWSDATPAALGGAHNVSRQNHEQIANEMLGGRLDVIIGAGNPDYDNDGRALAPDACRDYQWVGGRKTWESLKQGRRGWTLVQSRSGLEALASGENAPPAKMLGVPQTGRTLREKRSCDRATLSEGGKRGTTPSPFAVPFNRGVPSLATLSLAAIRCLGANPRGFYLMIEGGAVDWANHANEPERMIEEQLDFLKAVEAVVVWIESHGGWDDTLLILTADHDCGLLWGPNSDAAAFDPLVDRGSGKLPGLSYNARGHSNSLVPLYARGCGSRRFLEQIRGTDPKAAAVWRFSGRYIDNTDIFSAMKAELE